MTEHLQSQRTENPKHLVIEAHFPENFDSDPKFRTATFGFITIVPKMKKVIEARGSTPEEFAVFLYRSYHNGMMTSDDIAGSLNANPQITSAVWRVTPKDVRQWTRNSGFRLRTPYEEQARRRTQKVPYDLSS